MGLEDKLHRMCMRASSFSSDGLHLRTKDLESLVGEVLCKGKWKTLPGKIQRDLDEASDAAVNAAELADAVECIREQVFNPGNGYIEDYKISTDFQKAKEQIGNIFVARQVPQRGFVYVAWSAKPECFIYVGRAGGAKRGNPISHPKLAHSIGHMTTLSLIFPHQSRDNVLRDLEASVIRVVKHATGQMPMLNDRHEVVPLGDPTNRLSRLAGFLNKVADRVNAVGVR